MVGIVECGCYTTQVRSENIPEMIPASASTHVGRRQPDRGVTWESMVGRAAWPLAP